MTRIRMNTRMAGPHGNAEPGQIIEVDAAVAADLIAGGFAEEVAGPAIEEAVIAPPEKAVARKRRNP